MSQRIEELRRSVDQRAVTNAALTRTWVLQELKQNVSRAVQIEDLSAANRALELLGKELGMFVERKVVGLQDIRTASADELLNILAELDSAIEARQLTAGSQGTEEEEAQNWQEAPRGRQEDVETLATPGTPPRIAPPTARPGGVP